MKPRFFRLAKKIALTSGSKVRVGAVLVRGTAIMGMGCNDMSKSHPLMTEYSSGTRKPLIRIHAELAACRGWREVDSRFTLYIFRVRKDGSQGLAKPCNTCFKIVQNAGVNHIYFSLDDEGFGDLKIEQNR